MADEPTDDTRTSNKWLNSSQQDTVRVGRRIYRHLTRRTAVISVVLALAASLLASAIGPGSAVGQVLLVLVGILISVVVLPEEPHRLWNVTAADLAETVPAQNLLEAGRNTGKAIRMQAKSAAPDDAIDRVWSSALDGIVGILKEPSRLACDLRYETHLRPLDSGKYRVESSIEAKRCFPGAVDGRVWFSFCSSLAALNREYDEQRMGCLAREIVEPEPGEDLKAWSERMRGYKVSGDVNGTPLELVEKVDLQDEEFGLKDGADRSAVVRFVFRANEVTSGFVPIRLTIEFESAFDNRRYPVKFSAYFVHGATKITFGIRDSRYVIDCDEYFATSVTHGVSATPMKCSGEPRIEITAPERTVLLPGAGAVFSWREADNDLQPSWSLIAPTNRPIRHLPEGQPLPQASGPVPSRDSCTDLDEPLVSIAGHGIRVVDAYGELGILPRRQLVARAGVVERLRLGSATLPAGFELVILDGYRTLAQQSALLQHYGGNGQPGVHIASVGDDSMRPPHTTGGAVDITLAHHGIPLALGTDYDDFTGAAKLHHFEHEAASPLIRRLRRLLASVLIHAGFAPYEPEWWHWSYGDDVWADHYDTTTLYEIVERSAHGDPRAH